MSFLLPKRTLSNIAIWIDHNLIWEGHTTLFDGWLARAAILVPILGYMIIFNDAVVNYLTFKTITGDKAGVFMLDTTARLRFVYFGLLSLGLANCFYYLFKPWVHRHAHSSSEFVNYGLENFTPDNYKALHEIISKLGVKGVSPYADKELDQFYKQSGGDVAYKASRGGYGDFNKAREEFGLLLRKILLETFYRETSSNKAGLVLCLFLTFFGYVFLAIPSLDLFIAVIKSIF